MKDKQADRETRVDKNKIGFGLRLSYIDIYIYREREIDR